MAKSRSRRLPLRYVSPPWCPKDCTLDNLASFSITGDTLGSNGADLFAYRKHDKSTICSHETVLLSPTLSMEKQLAQCVEAVNKWGFVEGYDLIGDMVWDILINQRENGRFFEQMDGWMAEGYQNTCRLENLLGELHCRDERSIRAETVTEASQWLSRVHRSIEALDLRRNLVRRQGIAKAAEILCPQNIE